jgi:hypothetical protein
MTIGFREVFFSAVRVAWTVIGDFTPKQTLDELVRFAGEIRSRNFDAENQEALTRLGAQSDATEHAASVMTTSGASAQALADVKEQGALLQGLLEAPNFERDVWSGSLSTTVGAPDPILWQRAGDQAGTAATLGRLGRRTVAPLFEDRALRDRTVRLQAMVSARQVALRELRPLVAPENRAVVDAKLRAHQKVAVDISAARTEASRTVK